MNELLCALRRANVSTNRLWTPFVIIRLRTKAPDIKTTTVVDRSFPFRDQEVPGCIVPRAFDVMTDFVGLSQDDKLSSCGL